MKTLIPLSSHSLNYISHVRTTIKVCLSTRQIGDGTLFYILNWYWCWKSYNSLCQRGKKPNHILRPSQWHARTNLGVSPNIIKKIDDNLVIWKSDKSSFSMGLQREVESFTPAAISLFDSLSTLGNTPWEIIRKFFSKTEDLDSGYKKWLESSGPGCEHIEECDVEFYYSTPTSPYRTYHPLQNLKKEVQRERFKGCINIDITSAFLSLYWNEIGGKDIVGAPPFHFLLNPHMKKELEKKIMDDFGCDATQAKVLRNLIPSCNSNGHVVNESGYEDVSTGEWIVTNERISWFYDLREFVVDKIREYAKNVLRWKSKDRTPHLVLTYLEQRAMKRIWKGGEVVLRMHDGAIFYSADVEKLHKLAHPHLIKIEQW